MEKAIESYLATSVKQNGGISFKFVSPGTVGVPDRIVLYRGKVYFVELKDRKGILSAMQLAMHRKFKKHGIDVYILKSKGDVDEFTRFLFLQST